MWLPSRMPNSSGMAQLFETVLNNPLWIFLPGNLFLSLLDFCCPHFHLVYAWICRQVYDLPNKLELALSSSKLPSSCIQSCSPILLLRGLMRKFKFSLFLTSFSRLYHMLSYNIHNCRLKMSGFKNLPLLLLPQLLCSCVSDSGIAHYTLFHCCFLL